MSWSGFKKAINRAGTHVLMKTGQIEASIDLEFEFEEKRYKMMEEKSNKLQKELKEYLNTLRQVTSAQQNVSESISSYYGMNATTVTSSKDVEIDTDKTRLKNISQEYFNVMRKLNNETIHELEQPFFQTVLNPIARFNSYYIEVNEAIKKRSHKQLDYDALRNKVRKLVDNPPAPVETDDYRDNSAHEYELKLAEYEKHLETAERVYNTLNKQLKEELPKLINLRIPYLDPSFESFVKIQLLFFNENFQQLNDLQLKIDAKTRMDYIEGKLENRIDDVLLKMKELNITGSSH